MKTAKIRFSALVVLFIAAACGASTPTATPTAPTGTVGPSPLPSAMETQITATEIRAVTPTTSDPVQRGRALTARNGCAACHSPDGSPLVGPTWRGLFGSEETLADGSTLIVDEDYIIESILDPNAKVVQGYQPDLMPRDFAEKLSETDIEAIIVYIMSLNDSP